MGRALAHKSRHLIVRFRFNHVKASIIKQSLPEMTEMAYPGLWERCRWDKQDWVLYVPNAEGSESELWFGGLDEKERTEKILGTEYSSAFLNECSQIPWASRNMVIARVAQKTPLRLKTYYDENPPGEGHWTYRLFIQKRSPDNRMPLASPDDYAAFGPMNPVDNAANLPGEYLAEMEVAPERTRRRFYLGQWAPEAESALWTQELLEQSRVGDEVPEMQRVVVAIDPSGTTGNEDERSDEIGIVVCGIGTDGKGYVLEDLSGHYGPAQWGRVAVTAFDRHSADCVVGETNYGGDMVAEVIRSAAREGGAQRAVPFRKVTASRGKAIRAEPISALFEQGKVVLAGYFNALEDQLLGFTPAGYVGSKSPDRADAMIHGLTHLFPGITRREQAIHRQIPEVVVAYAEAKRHTGGSMPMGRMPRVITRRD